MVPAFIAFIVGMGLLATVYQPTAMLIAAALLGFGVGRFRQAAWLWRCVSPR